MSSKKTTVTIGFGGWMELLTIIFIILKVTEVVSWSWFIVFLPVIIKYGFVLGICAFTLLMTFLVTIVALVAVVLNPSAWEIKWKKKPREIEWARKHEEEK